MDKHQLRDMYIAETGNPFPDDIVKYADWLEEKLLSRKDGESVEGNWGMFDGIKVMVSKFIPDNEMYITTATFDKMNEWFGKVGCIKNLDEALPTGKPDTECKHEWGIDGVHSNEYCKKCFISKPGHERS